MNHLAENLEHSNVRTGAGYDVLRALLLTGMAQGKSKLSASKEVAKIITPLQKFSATLPGFEIDGMKPARSGDFFTKSGAFVDRAEYKPWIGVDIDEEEIFNAVEEMLLHESPLPELKGRDVARLVAEVTQPMHDKVENIQTRVRGLTPFAKSTEISLGKWWPAFKPIISSFVERSVGSTLLLERIDEHFHAQRGPAKVVLVGMSGAGKTMAAKWYASKNEAKYTHIFWIDCEGEQTIKTSFNRLGDKLGLRKSDSYFVFEDFVADVYEKLSDLRCLFLFDNAIRYSDQENEAGLRTFLPKAANHHALITSKKQTWGNTNEFGILSIEIGVFTIEECAQLFEKTLGKTHKNGGLTEFLSLAEEVQRLPLALQIAVAAIGNPHSRLTIGSYHQLLKQDLDELTNTDVLDEYESSARTITATLNRSILQIEGDQRASDECKNWCNTMLIISSYCEPDRISESIFNGLEGANEDLIRKALQNLADYSLLQVQGEETEMGKDGASTSMRVFGIHRLLQHVIRRKASHEDNVGYIKQRTLHVETIRLALRSFKHYEYHHFVHFVRMWATGSAQFVEIARDWQRLLFPHVLNGPLNLGFVRSAIEGLKSKFGDSSLSVIQLRLLLLELLPAAGTKEEADVLRKQLTADDNPHREVLHLHLEILSFEHGTLVAANQEYLHQCVDALERMTKLEYDGWLECEGSRVQLHCAYRREYPSLSLRTFLVVCRAVCVFYTNTVYNPVGDDDASSSQRRDAAAKLAANIILEEVITNREQLSILSFFVIGELFANHAPEMLSSASPHFYNPAICEVLKRENSVNHLRSQSVASVMTLYKQEFLSPPFADASRVRAAFVDQLGWPAAVASEFVTVLNKLVASSLEYPNTNTNFVLQLLGWDLMDLVVYNLCSRLAKNKPTVPACLNRLLNVNGRFSLAWLKTGDLKLVLRLDEAAVRYMEENITTDDYVYNADDMERLHYILRIPEGATTALEPLAAFEEVLRSKQNLVLTICGIRPRFNPVTYGFGLLHSRHLEVERNFYYLVGSGWMMDLQDVACGIHLRLHEFEEAVALSEPSLRQMQETSWYMLNEFPIELNQLYSQPGNIEEAIEYVGRFYSFKDYIDVIIEGVDLRFAVDHPHTRLCLKFWRHGLFVTLKFAAENWDTLSPTNLKTLFLDLVDISENELESQNEVLDSITRRVLKPWGS